METKKVKLYLKNARIVTEDDDFWGGVTIQDGKIKYIVRGDEHVDASKTIDLNGKVLMPGLVDSHVHFNEPGRKHWEGYRTGSMAAAAGGITTFIEMPLNSIPETLSKETLDQKLKAVQSESVVDYGNWGGLVDNNLDSLDGLVDGGVVGFKAFLSNSGIENFERIDDDLLYAGLSKIRELGSVLGLHAENEYVTKYLGKKLREAGRNDRPAWYQSRPPFSELEAIKRACYWADVTGSNLHIFHVTIADGIIAASQAKDEGTNVTVETCPHYLYFDQDDFVEIGPAAKCAPPLRSSQEVKALWDCVLDGTVDTIGSDHSPCTWEEKASGMDDIWKAWGGISGVQTMLSVILSEGVHKRGLPLKDVVRMMSSNPARLSGLYPRKGALESGSDADITVIDLDEEWTVRKEDLFYRNKFSAFEGAALKGKVTHTIVRGEIVYQEGEFMVQPGFGKHIKRQ